MSPGEKINEWGRCTVVALLFFLIFFFSFYNLYHANSNNGKRKVFHRLNARYPTTKVKKRKNKLKEEEEEGEDETFRRFVASKTWRVELAKDEKKERKKKKCKKTSRVCKNIAFFVALQERKNWRGRSAYCRHCFFSFSLSFLFFFFFFFFASHDLYYTEREWKGWRKGKRFTRSTLVIVRPLWNERSDLLLVFFLFIFKRPS